MRTTPFYDAFEFLIGTSTFHKEAGTQGIFMVPLFWGLLIASVLIARRNWLADPTQRTPEHLATWFIRLMVGVMWFEGSVWKLPLPISGGFSYWVDQMAQFAAFDVHKAIVTSVYKPLLFLINPLVFLTELSLAVSYILGFGVRLAGCLGMAFAFHLYLGLYRHPGEWPWAYIAIVLLQGFFVIHAAGRSLGLDAMLRKAKDGLFAESGRLGRLYRVAS